MKRELTPEQSAVFAAAWQQARARWPQLATGAPEFERHLAALSIALDEPPPFAADLYLACACLAGERRAHEEFTNGYLALGRVRAWIAPATTDFAEDVRQDAADWLLVGRDGEPKLATFAGQGPLAAFVRVFVVRMAQQRRRLASAKGHVDADDATMPNAPRDPELALARHAYAKAFEEAFRATLAELDVDDRNMLRLHYLDGLSIEAVGAAYRVSRATAARTLARARATIFKRVRDKLGAKLGESFQARSLISLVRSEISFSLARYMASE